MISAFLIRTEAQKQQIVFNVANYTIAQGPLCLCDGKSHWFYDILHKFSAPS